MTRVEKFNQELSGKVEGMVKGLGQEMALLVAVKELPGESEVYFDGAVVYKNDADQLISILVGENSGGTQIMEGRKAIDSFLKRQLGNNLTLVEDEDGVEYLRPSWIIEYVSWEEYVEEFIYAGFTMIFR